jgi:hypothetical protein
LERNQVLYEQRDTINYVYFPIDSVVSNLAIMEEGMTFVVACNSSSVASSALVQ